jgi:hypothetical protein
MTIFSRGSRADNMALMPVEFVRSAERYNMQMGLVEIGWIDLAPDKGKWRSVVNVVMDLLVH